MFASPDNSGNGEVVWVESEDKSQFSACIYEYSGGSNAIEINWIALKSAPSGAQIGTTLLDSWTTETDCKKIHFPQVSHAFSLYEHKSEITNNLFHEPGLMELSRTLFFLYDK